MAIDRVEGWDAAPDLQSRPVAIGSFVALPGGRRAPSRSPAPRDSGTGLPMIRNPRSNVGGNAVDTKNRRRRTSAP